LLAKFGIIAYQIGALHRPEDTIVRNRRRPKRTGTNARITRPIFGNNSRKELAIPRAIDDYNHHMNGVDLANQYRAWLTCHRSGIYKPWQPLFYWLLDICAVNAFLIWKVSKEGLDPKDSRLHRKFHEELINALLDYSEPDPTPAPAPAPAPPQASQAGPLPQAHTVARFPTRGVCIQCKELRGGGPKRRVLEELPNGVNRQFKSPQRSDSGCATCGHRFCIKGPCFANWHRTHRLG